jgi:hypothetical protein
MITEFSLNKIEKKRFKKWRKKNKLVDGFTFRFYPTGIGVAVTITHIDSKKSIDVTNYSCW